MFQQITREYEHMREIPDRHWRYEFSYSEYHGVYLALVSSLFDSDYDNALTSTLAAFIWLYVEADGDATQMQAALETIQADNMLGNFYLYRPDRYQQPRDLALPLVQMIARYEQGGNEALTALWQTMHANADALEDLDAAQIHDWIGKR